MAALPFVKSPKGANSVDLCTPQDRFSPNLEAVKGSKANRVADEILLAAGPVDSAIPTRACQAPMAETDALMRPINLEAASS